MKFLLINPPFYRFIGLEQDYVPLSLLAVGTKLKADGNEVFLKNMEVDHDLKYRGYAGRSDDYDNYLSSLNNPDHKVWKEMEKTIEDIKPDKIGITALNVKYRSVLKIIEMADRRKIPVVVGGAHATTSPDAYPKQVEVFHGEFESHGKRISNLDTLPFPDYDMLMDQYTPNGYAHMITSRGCPYACKFCSSGILWERKLTFKSVDRILSEMQYIEERYHSDYFTFWDEVFMVDKKRLREFCARYKLNAHWRCDTRADLIDDEIVRMMKDSGCGQMSMGIECASNETLKLIGKSETREDFVKAAEILNNNGIQWKAYCMIGFPSETEEDIRETLRFTKSLKPFRITLSFFTPYVGTPLFQECKDMGLINDNYDMALYSHQSPHNHFCPKIPMERFIKLRHEVSEDADTYNAGALKVWK